MKKAAILLAITTLYSCSNNGDNQDHDTLKDTARDIATRAPETNLNAAALSRDVPRVG
jgi:hypothetical protein